MQSEDIFRVSTNSLEEMKCFALNLIGKIKDNRFMQNHAKLIPIQWYMVSGFCRPSGCMMPMNILK